MSSAIYKIFNGPAPTTAAQLAVTTGTAIKTMLQAKAIAALSFKVRAWGFSMDAAAAAAGVQWELLTTGTVGATVTAHAAAGVVAWNSRAAAITPSTFFTLSTGGTGYTASAEGVIVASKMFESEFVQPTGERAWEFSLGNEPIVVPGDYLRIRCKAAAAVNALCWVLVEV